MAHHHVVVLDPHIYDSEVPDAVRLPLLDIVMGLLVLESLEHLHILVLNTSVDGLRHQSAV